MHGYYRLQSTQQRLRHDDSATVFLSKRKQETRSRDAGRGRCAAQRPAETHKTTQHALPIDRLSAADGGAGRLPPATPFRMQQPMPPLSLPARRRARGRTADGRNERSTFPTARHTGSRTLSSDGYAGSSPAHCRTRSRGSLTIHMHVRPH